MFLKIQKEMKTSHFCNILKMMSDAHPLQTNIWRIQRSPDLLLFVTLTVYLIMNLS